MQIFSASHEILHQLDSLLGQIHLKDFSRPSGLLNGSTIGQHVRHTLEFFLCLEKGFTGGVINYDKRARDMRIETDTVFATSPSVISDILLHRIQTIKFWNLKWGMNNIRIRAL